MKVEINENDPIWEKFGNEYFNAFCIHSFVVSVYPFDISKMNKFIENLAKLFNKATSLSCHKKNNATVLDNPNSREHLLWFGS